MSQGGWIGVDLDGTLAKYEGWNDGEIGEPVPAMLEQVLRWLSEGLTVKIMTARVHAFFDERCDRAAATDALKQMRAIEDWCLQHFGRVLEVTCMKDFAMTCLYDDRCVQVEPNTGRFIGATNTFPQGKISGDDEGEPKIAMANDGKVVMVKFGKPIDWIGLGAEEARQLANGLLHHAAQVSS